MTLWLNRAGSHGEYESKFLDEERIYLTWDGLKYDLSALASKSALADLLRKVYPNAPKGRISQNTGQIWPFAHEMKPGDWVALPSKMKAAIHMAEITGPYVFAPDAEDPYYHYHTVKWLETDIPRQSFAPDVLLSLGAFSTICKIQRHDAEKRVRAMAAAGWKAVGVGKLLKPALAPEQEDNGETDLDLELLARDRIAELIISRFKGHGMAVLVESLLKALGYITFRSPAGPDKGVDILAAPAPIGFGSPKIAVQVKSGDGPVDRPTLDQLIGTMQNFQAEQGILVSWGGFKSSIDKEKAMQFFRVRLWDQQSLIERLLEHYDKLDEDIRAELPLKRIWTVAEPEEEEGSV
jgi:restriction system protein